MPLRTTETKPDGRKENTQQLYEQKTIAELYQIAKELQIPQYYKLRKQELVFEICKAKTVQGDTVFAKGVLEIAPDGYGFLHPTGLISGNEDIYVSQSQIRKFDLRTGDMVAGQVRNPQDNERYYAMLRIEQVNGEHPQKAVNRLHFPGLTPVYPYEKIQLETTKGDLSMRLIDLVSPLGKGQRGLILAPPKAGKTILLKKVANSISENYPDINLLILLIDERPEEVTDIERSVQAEVISSTFDQLPESHVRVAEMVLARAKSLVEQGQDVVVLLDSITRLARANNLVIPPSGRTLSGGLDPAALHGPKRFFGSARKVEEGGSLTILATALMETGSRMDEVIFEEFKGTGNMELVLDRSMAERRLFPAIDVKKSGTRREDLLLSPPELDLMWSIRKATAGMPNAESLAFLLDAMEKTKSNQQLLQTLPAILQGSKKSGRK